MRKPQVPEENEVSVTMICQLAGSLAPVGQALAYKVLPTTRNRKVYDVPADAEKGTEPIVVVEPATLFCITNVVPFI